MNTTRKHILTIIVHIIAWLIFLSLPTLFDPRIHHFAFSNFVDNILEPPRWRNALLLIAVFYFNYYHAIPKFYLQRRYVAYFSIFVAWLAIFFAINYYSRNPGMPPGPPMHIPPPMGDMHMWQHPPDLGVHRPPGDNPFVNSFNLFMFLLIFTFSFALCLYEQWQKTKEQMLHTEISFLKAQINPHFLFNTLNSIYSLALTKSDNTADAVVKLSGMMRYSVSETNHNFVSLSKEIAYVSNYIDLQRLRVTSRMKISYEVTGVEHDKQIVPFLLIPFVENAFKYGINPEEDSDISIKIEIGTENVLLKVTNKKVFVRQDKREGTGIGIETTRKRLKLHYPGKHTLDITDTDNAFSVLLQINIL